jgi:hypothetical protein
VSTLSTPARSRGADGAVTGQPAIRSFPSCHGFDHGSRGYHGSMDFLFSCYSRDSWFVVRYTCHPQRAGVNGRSVFGWISRLPVSIQDRFRTPPLLPGCACHRSHLILIFKSEISNQRMSIGPRRHNASPRAAARPLPRAVRQAIFRRARRTGTAIKRQAGDCTFVAGRLVLVSFGRTGGSGHAP